MVLDVILVILALGVAPALFFIGIAIAARIVVPDERPRPKR